MTKIYSNIFDEITNFKNIIESHRKAITGSKKFKKEAVIFSLYEDKNLVDLWKELKNMKYTPSDYIEFEVFEPKRRTIHAPRIRDKIVQFAVHNVIKEVYKNIFIRHSYACLEERGTHAAVAQVQKNMRICEREWGNAWIVKVDISKYFYSVNRCVLKRLYRKKIRCRHTLWLLDLIVDGSPTQEGIPLGNVTSQDFANIYLNELDQYVTRFLKVKHYVRYMDDAIAIVQTKEEAQILKKKIGAYVKKFLFLELNPKKSQIFPLSQGVNAYGFKIWTTHKKVRDCSKRAMKRRMKAMHKKFKNKEMRVQEVKNVVNSWLGHARHSNSYNLCKKIFKNYKYIRIEGNEKFGNR